MSGTGKAASCSILIVQSNYSVQQMQKWPRPVALIDHIHSYLPYIQINSIKNNDLRILL